MTKATVIIPVYNSEKTVSIAVRSLLEQTFTDFEILCVNDCSTDDSLLVLKNLQEEDDYDRIRIIENKENCGPSQCRNIALKQAKGDYIFYVDSDDVVIDKNFIKTVVSKFEETNAGSIWFKGYNYNPYTDKYLPMDTFKDYYEIKEGFFKVTADNIGPLPAYLWLKAFRKDTLLDGDFSLSGYLFEDLEFLWKYYTKNPDVYFIDKEFYLYVGNKSSLIKSTDYIEYAEVFNVMERVYNYLKKTGLFTQYKKSLLICFNETIKEYVIKSYNVEDTKYCKYIANGLKLIHYPEDYMDLEDIFPFYEYL